MTGGAEPDSELGGIAGALGALAGGEGAVDAGCDCGTVRLQGRRPRRRRGSLTSRTRRPLIGACTASGDSAVLCTAEPAGGRGPRGLQGRRGSPRRHEPLSCAEGAVRADEQT